MSVEAFVRTAGGVMGSAREGFGAGLPVVGWGAPRTPPPPADDAGLGSGAAVDAHGRDGGRLAGELSALGSHDAAAAAQLADSVAAAHGGRARMDAVIAAAVADVAALGLSTGTPAGQKALVEAIERRLAETKATIADGSSAAATQAASADTAAAGYNGIAPPAATAPAGLPMMGGGGMPMMGGGAGMPMMGGGGLPMMPTSALQGLSGLSGLMAGRPAAGGDPVSAVKTAGPAGGAGKAAALDKIAVSSVEFDRRRFPGGKEAYQRYIGQALDVMGVSDPAARRRWTIGLMTAAQRESGFNPLAINLDDTNARSTAAVAADGFGANASRGGLQTIPGTFAAYHQAGTSTNIYDPLANICASMNYVMGPKYRVAADASNLFTAVGQFNPMAAGGGY